MRLLAKVSCILVGVLFIFSGLIKAVDPLGFSYKLEEYFQVFHLGFLSFSSVILAYALCALEVIIGLALLLRYKINYWSWWLMSVIIFFTILTGASAIFDIVKDCGCFGDALKLSPYESFIKDIVLLILSSLILYYRLYLFPVFSKQTLNSYILVLGACLSLGISAWGNIRLPLIDYRAYKVGNNLIEKMNDGRAPVFESSFIYKNKKSGLEKEFDMNGLKTMNYEEWEWKETKNKIISEGKENSIHDFIILNEDGSDITEELISKSSVSLFIISYNLNKADKEGFIKIAKLAKELPDINFYGLSNGTHDQNEDFRHEIQASFPFYSLDQTTLKTMIRSNPGLMLIQKASVLKKWHINEMPDKEVLLNYIK
jgi:hypothetical protein